MVKRSQIKESESKFYRHRRDHRRRLIVYTFWSKTIFRMLFKSHHTQCDKSQYSFPFRFTCKLLFTCYHSPFITFIRKSSYYYQMYVCIHTTHVLSNVKSTYFSLLAEWGEKKNRDFRSIKTFFFSHPQCNTFVCVNTRTYFHGLLASFCTLSNSIDKTIFNTMKSNHTTQERACFFYFSLRYLCVLYSVTTILTVNQIDWHALSSMYS